MCQDSIGNLTVYIVYLGGHFDLSFDYMNSLLNIHNLCKTIALYSHGNCIGHYTINA